MSIADSFLDRPERAIAALRFGKGSSEPGTSQKGLMSLLREHASSQADAPAFVFPLDDDCLQQLSWEGLHRVAHQYAAYIAGAGAGPGDTVVVLSSSVAEQVLGFLGAIAAGCVPTIVSYPSSKQSAASFAAMLSPVLTHSCARLLLYGKQFAQDVSGLGEVTSLVPFPEFAALPPQIATIARHPDEPLFLQFSSGTTGTRKAVAVTETMLMNQAFAYARAVDLQASDKVVSWLPLYHDMGLLAAFLIPICHGITGIHVSPFQWLMRPELLFEIIEQHQATLLWLPNFAYEFCVARIDAHTGARLGSLRAIVNCSEPVSKRAHDHFRDAFGALGVRPESLQTCYAMAETTFAVTQSNPRRPAMIDRVDREQFLSHHRAVPAAHGAVLESTMALVSCGTPIEGTEVRINGVRGEREIGEIEVKSASLFSGYLFNAEGADPFTADGWFRTGDLGYFAAGELYVTGRSKDVIIRRGHNIYPTDIEEAVAEVDGCKGGRVVAFGVDNADLGTQDLVLMVERAGDDIDAMALRIGIREKMLAVLNETATDIVVCEPNTLRKSTSGKLSRSGNRQLYMERHASRLQAKGESELDSRQSIADPLEQELERIWSRALGVRHVAVDARLFAELGGDSLTAMQVVGEITRQFGKAIEPITLLREDTVRRQAQLLRSGAHTSDGVLTCLQRGAARTPLFLVHAASGRAWPYRTLLPYLDQDRPVYAFQAPELFGTREFLDVDEMVGVYIEKLLDIQPNGPYLLGGWSFGGVIAHALANRLVGMGHIVSRLVLFDTDPPASAISRLRYLLRQGLIRHAALHWNAPAHRLIAPRGASSCARFLAALRPNTTSSRELAKLMHFACSEHFDHVTGESETVEELWAALKGELEVHSKPEESRPFLIVGQDAATQLQNARVLVKNRRDAVLYKPRHRFPGRLDIIAANDPFRLVAWSRYASDLPRVHTYPITGTDVLTPHFCMFEPKNVALFGADVNALLNQESQSDTVASQRSLLPNF